MSYAKQWITEGDVEAVSKALSLQSITRGEELRLFEEELAKYAGARFAVCFNSGTTALSAAYAAGELKPFDRLITTPNTFIGTIAGALPLTKQITLVDVDPKSGNLLLDQLEEAINHPLSRGREWIVPVHFAGVALDMKRLSKMIKRQDTVVVEDAAHALGSCYPSGERVGSCAYSDMTIFSFHPAKQITTGEGGAVLTNSEELALRLRLYRNNGIEPLQDPEEPWSYVVKRPSGNFHMNELQAALGRSQLKRIDAIIKRRRSLIGAYRKALPSSIGFFDEALDPITSYHLALIHHPFTSVTRKALRERLQEAGFGSQVHYIPLYRHPALPKIAPLPGMEEYYKGALSLPLYHEFTEDQVLLLSALLRG